MRLHLETAALALSLGTLLAGCGGTTSPDASAVNPDKPNANAQIVSQGAFGEADSYSLIFGLDLADDGNVAFHGNRNGRAGAGSLTAAGAVRWFQQLAFTPGAVAALAATGPVPNGVIVFGKHNIDADSDSERGDVALFSATGALLGELQLGGPGEEVFINAAVPITDSSFIAVGGERNAGVETPWIVEIIVRPGGQLFRGGSATLRGVLTGRLSEVAAVPAGGEIRLFAINDAPGASRVHGLRVTTGTIAPAAVDWSRDVLPTMGTRLFLAAIAVSGPDVYVAGYADDNRKGMDSGGNFWLSALMVSFTTAGDPRWSTLVGVTGHSEYFQDLVVDADTVYGVGAAAAYIHRGRYEFGYGLVTKLDPATGTAGSSFTFGSDAYESEFEAVALKGANLLAGGWTFFDVRGGTHSGWLVELLTDAPGPEPGRAASGPRAGPDDASRPPRHPYLTDPSSSSGSR